jgi:signal transduction histidine kinase
VSHAGAEHIRVTASATDAALEIRVEDDGRGFDPTRQIEVSAADGHFGLAGMLERATQFGGTARIDSAPGHGTTVTVSVPPAVVGRSHQDRTATSPGKREEVNAA